jgi:hypothetical protein
LSYFFFYLVLYSGGDELMKKVKLIIAGVAMVSLVSSSAVYADGYAPGEGLYIGAFVGASAGIVQPKVVTEGGDFDANGVLTEKGGTFEARDGGLGLMGISGGGMLGYGYKMGGLYAGLEGEMAYEDVKFKVTSDTTITIYQDSENGTEYTVTELEATREWTGGMFGRLGFYVNPDTLLAFRGGVLVSKFNVKITGSPNYSDNFYGGGPSVGASLESRISAIDPNLSLRMDTVYTDYLTASVYNVGANQPSRRDGQSGSDNEVTGSSLSARIGLQYSFFDVNSLF